MIQLYAPFAPGYDSFAYLGREIVRFLRSHHFLGQVYATKTAFPDYTGVQWPVGLETSAHIGIYVGYPIESSGWLHGHEHRILFTTCETSPVPPIWVQACNRATLVVVPSQFCKETFEKHGVRTPILVCRHGVQPEWLSRPRPERQPGPPRILHVAAPSSYPRRKGTSALLVAAKKLWDEGLEFELVLKGGDGKQLCDATSVNGFNRYAIRILTKQEPDMFELLTSVDAVCQPSRGEGFGLVPLEARACGTRVIMTNVTGHTEHAGAADIFIKTGAARHMPTIGNEVGYAPTVAPYDIAASLRKFLETTYQPTRTSQSWTWNEVLRPLLPHLKASRKGSKFQGAAFLRGIG